ncbi:hypothetical protein FW774_08990 [Pedobacter sp. BS3]|uniref:hypothetical protein n=1 Tax=Pedobacter sp. BS3 TaxID=2567937 RepID=UPI0011EDB33D|nr:hypothetical protein [Pedobacter sp. BS3]TZF83604.1 hypothetical protein FW774_08990 [Pedobacter sp. BS3]
MNTSYIFRKSALEKTQYWELTDEGILCRQEGKTDALIPYQKVQSIRLSYLANNRYRLNNYCCKITAGQKTADILSSSYEGMATFNNQADTYIPFVKELVKRVKNTNPYCNLYAGQTPFVFYGNIAFTFVIVVILFLIFYYLPISGGLSIFVRLMLIGYYAIFLVKSFRVNKPQQITGYEIPANILPEIAK